MAAARDDVGGGNVRPSAIPLPSYAAQVPPADRWAIAAYIRALQLSQHYDASALAAEERANLDRPAPAAEPPAPAH